MFLIETKGNLLVAVGDFAFSDFVNRRVILDAGYLVDVETTTRIVEFTRYRKVTMSA